MLLSHRRFADGDSAGGQRVQGRDSGHLRAQRKMCTLNFPGSAFAGLDPASNTIKKFLREEADD